MNEVPAARVVFSDADRAAVLDRVEAALRSGSLTLGPQTAELEAAFAARHGGGHAVATASGTSALEIVVRALRVDAEDRTGPGRGGAEVIVPADTFFATAAAVLHAGGRVRADRVQAAVMQQRRVVVPDRADEHPRTPVAQAGGHGPRVLQDLPAQLQYEPLLRVHRRGLAR